MISVKRALIISAIVLLLFFYASRQERASSISGDQRSISKIRGGSRPEVHYAESMDHSSEHDTESIDQSKAQKQEAEITQVIPAADSGSRKYSKAPRPGVANMKNEPLREQLAFQFPYDVSSKFPAFIWQTWKYTAANPKFGEHFRPFEASWTSLHPDFIHEVITDQVALHLIRHLYSSVPQVLEAFVSLPSAILKADFFRYLILLARGGVYSDIDTAALKPATNWIPTNFRMNSIGLVVGIEADAGNREDWAKWYSRRIQFCQWTIQSKPGHPVLREVVARITEKTLSRKLEGTLRQDQKDVMEFTGPATWTDAIFGYLNDDSYFDIRSPYQRFDWANFTGMAEPKKIGDVVVLPITSFSPGVGHSGAGEDDDPLAFVHHHFEGTWKPESERHIGGTDEDPKLKEKSGR